MPSEKNRDTIKTAFVTLLKTNSSLFTTTGEDDKLRAIEVGRPEDEINDAMIPYAFVRNGRGTFENIEPQKIAVGDTSQLIVHELFFDIIVIVSKKDSRTTEALHENSEELILETLQADQNITGTVDTSDVVRIADYPFPSVISAKMGRIITVRCTKVTS